MLSDDFESYEEYCILMNKEIGSNNRGYFNIKVTDFTLQKGCTVYHAKVEFVLEDGRKGMFMQTEHLEHTETFVKGCCYVTSMLKFNFEKDVTRFCDNPMIEKSYNIE